MLSTHPAPSVLLFTTLVAAIGLLWSTSPPALHAQSNDASTSPRSVLLKGKTILQGGVNKGSLDSLRKARALFKQATNGDNHQSLAHYYAALANVRMLNQLPQKAKDRRKPLVNDAIDHLETATDLAPKKADAWALLTSCYGQKMGIQPMKAQSLAPKSEKAMKKAMELGPKNPRVWLISGRQDYFTPEMYGGDKERGLKKMKKAAKLAEQERIEDPLQPSWGHAEAYAWIGFAHMNAERTNQARKALEKALAINPEYGFVKDYLLPELEKKSK
jgi:tetratricopeptide (TPR) repeat protein